MSKQQRERPATVRAPIPETESSEQETVPVAAVPAAAAFVAPPPTPVEIKGVAWAVYQKWGVPVWLTKLAAWTGSKFHKEMPGNNNALGIRAFGTMQRNERGWAWFGNVPISYDQFGAICRGMDFSDPAACVAALKTKCPKIDTFFISHFIAEA